ncbi:MAG: radical SAM family heme chaperone HemW [candidate division Zixibacteria bacterium]|nr:radical SAM family heme chaperone HemW [candidate division Zixibacteria bacterium]MDH3938678.1 radical SAM family heme chaperone HemW [candidate division Zixibacteria bacterium]
MPLGLYLHYPFCRNRCSYCDFYKELHDTKLQKQFFDALRTETDLIAGQCGKRRVRSIFIGGGTPSLMPVELLEDWLAQVRDLFIVEDDFEFSVESNPESVSLELLQSWQSLGVNRPLFGVQSFDPQLLKLLDRRHSPKDSHRAVYHANALGFASFGLDLIFGLPGQNSDKLSADLEQFVDLAPPHISFYQLTIEDGTVLADRVADGSIKLPDEELNLAMYRAGVQKMEEAGYRRYEVSSFAKPGFECRHNLGYWEGDEYLGLGPSAHSFIDGQRLFNYDNLHRYIETLDKGHLPQVVDESGLDERMTEAIMLGLRTTQGISRKRFVKRFGVSLRDRLDQSHYRRLVESGHLLPDRGKLRLSDEGFYLVDEITRCLIK